MRDPFFFFRLIGLILRLAVSSIFLGSVFPVCVASADDQQASAHFIPDTAALYRKSSEAVPPAAADVLVLEDDETVIFDAEGKVARSRYLLYKIITQKGAQDWADLAYSWEPWREERPALKARVITPDNAGHPLDAATISDAPARDTDDSVFSDRRVLRAPLPAIAPGSLVEEEVISKESTPFFGAGSVERFFLGRSAPVQHTRLILDAPSSLPLRYKLELLPDLKPARTEAEGRVRIVFDHGPIEPFDETELQLPSDIPAYANIAFSTGASWQQVATEYGNIVNKQIAAVDLKPLVARLTVGRTAPRDRAAALLQYIDREVRYTGVEFAEAAIIPNSPRETLTRKYGDCKDKAALLVAMLRTAGVPAYVALLKAGGREDVAPDLPGMGMFDHAIVFVPGSPDLWIDPTDEYARLGQLPVSDQGRLALIARPGIESLVLTAVSASAENILLEKREIHLAENGPARVVETSQPQGSLESTYRRSYADKQNKSQRDNLTSYVKAQYLADKLDRLDRSDPTDLSQPFQLTLEANHARRGVTDLDGAAAGIRFDTLFSRLPSDLQQGEKEPDPKAEADAGKKPKPKRTADYQLPEAFVTEWQYSIFPPVGFKPKPLPANSRLALGPAVLTEDFSSGTDGVVHAIIRFDTVKRRLTVTEATDLRNNVAQLLAGPPILIYFEPIGQSLLHQGKVREALQSYRDLIAFHPKEAVHHLQIAQVLLEAGLGEAARAEAQTAVKLEPSSALAEKTLAYVLEDDLVGRRFRPGSDYAGAEAAFRAAEKLDPDDKGIVADLAILLEFDHWGARYSPAARLKDSAAEYRKLTPEKRTELGMQTNLAFTLFYGSEFADAEKEAESLNPPPIALIVACEATLHGSQAALSEARKRTAGEDQFKQIAEAAGQMLANIRKYPLAADLQEAGASGTNASDTAAFALLYRRTQPHEQLALPDSPAGVAMRLELLTDDPNLTLGQLRSICSRNGASAFATQDVVDDLRKEERGLLSQKARDGLFANIGADIALTRAQPMVQGNDASGYLVTLWGSASYKSLRFVVKEEGTYKLLATRRFPEAVGLEVLDRLQSGDLAGARMLLDWMREDWHLLGGDDPLSSAAFPRLWTKGSNAGIPTIRLAAASILSGSSQTSGRAASILEEARKSPAHEADRVSILLGLLAAYNASYEYEKVLPVCEELASLYPDSARAFINQSFALRALGRFDQADKVAADRLERMPGDVDSMRALARNAAARGDFAKAHALEQNILDQGKAGPGDLNSVAWRSLFLGKVEPSDIDAALKASQLAKDNAAVLHTLGCLYAEVGKTKEAREVLIHSMDLLDLDEPNPDYWFAFGRIAEQSGEREAAIVEYRRVTKPKDAADIPESSYSLAQLRLQALLKSTNEAASAR